MSKRGVALFSSHWKRYSPGMAKQGFVALLRGINVGGHNKIPMAQLRELATHLGWQAVRTYIQSGNIVFEHSASAKALETELESAIESALGLVVPVIVRSQKQWEKYCAGNPFEAAAAERPNLVMLALSKTRPKGTAATQLESHGNAGERAKIAAGALWLDFLGGSGKSRISPAVLDRFVGSQVTMRNWRSVLKLQSMLAE